MNQFDRALMCETGLVFGLLVYPQLKETKTIRSFVSVDDFADPDLGEMFSIILEMQDEKIPLTEYTVFVNKMIKSGVYKRIGGWDEFESLLMRKASTQHVGNAIEIRELAIRRRMIQALAEAKNQLDDPSDDQFAIAHKLTKQLIDLSASREVQVKFSSEVSAEILLDLAQTPKPLVKTGLSKFDREVGGFTPGELIIIAARTSIGKSALAAQIAEFNSNADWPVLFITLEMDSKDIVRRILARKSGVDVKTMRSGQLSAGQLEAITAAAATGETSKLIPLYMPASKIEDIQNVIVSIAAKFKGLQLVVVDYIQIVKAPDTRMSARESIGETTRALKRLAGVVSCPIIALSQLNRDSTKQEAPTLASMAESSSIEADADMVLAIHRRSPNEQEGKLLVLKNRNGETIDLNGLLWSGQAMQFWFQEPRQNPGFENYQ